MSAGNKSKHPGRAGKWKKKRGADVKLYGGADAAKLINKSVDDTDQLYTYNVKNFKVKLLSSAQQLLFWFWLLGLCNVFNSLVCVIP